MKKKLGEDIQNLALQLKDAQMKIAVEIKEGSVLHHEGVSRILRSVHHANGMLLKVPDKLLRIAEDLISLEDLS